MGTFILVFDILFEIKKIYICTYFKMIPVIFGRPKMFELKININ